MDLDAYRDAAERFTTELGREYYNHFAGHQDEFEIEAIYERHADLFERSHVDDLRELLDAAPDGSDERRSARLLLNFAVEGLMGQATKSLAAQLAMREAQLKIDVDGEQIGFRESSVLQANEPDRDRRERIEAARLEATEQSLNPLAREALEQVHSLSRELGWDSYRALCEELSGIDLAGLERQTAAFAAASDEAYAQIVGPELERAAGVGLGEARRSDIPWFFRNKQADEHFPVERLVPSFTETMAAMGIDVAAQSNVVLDVEKRAKKSPRAFCAPVRVPHEVYLVVPPVGGRDDFVALFHEGGHTEHFAHISAELPFEFRHLGDNSITEGFAFLFDHMVEDEVWMSRRLGIDAETASQLAGHVRASRLVYLRRYAAKLAYELELHDAGERPLDELADVYASRLSAATGVPWPATTWLTDVDPGFYAASYLRAWSLETHLRATLRERHGDAWFDEPAAGDFLKQLWSDGQRLDADELLAQVSGAQLDFSAMLSDVGLS